MKLVLRSLLKLSVLCKSFLAIISALFCAFPMQPIIIKVSQICEASSYFEEADQDTLVLFDIDSTLTTPSDPYLRRKSIQEHKAIYDYYVKKLTKNQFRIFNHLLVLQSVSLLIESDFIEIIKNLQKKGVRTLACTASKTGKVGNLVKSFPEWRFRELENLDINFSQTFPGSALFTSVEDYEGDFPGIEKGIIYTDYKIKKGKLLSNIINKLKFVPRKLIVIDDKRENIESFLKEIKLKYPQIHFVGIEYQGIKQITSAPVNAEKFKEKISSLAKQAICICD